MKVENFSEKEQLADDLERVGAKVEEKREIEKAEKPGVPESPERKKEIVKRLVGEMAKEAPLEPTDAQGHPVSNGARDEDNYLPDYMEEEDVDEQTERIIESLLQVVVDGGIMKALRDSRKYPPFVQDAFHDALADKLIPELEKRGKL